MNIKQKHVKYVHTNDDDVRGCWEGVLEMKRWKTGNNGYISGRPPGRHTKNPRNAPIFLVQSVPERN
jgi:hypothetical protein